MAHILVLSDVYPDDLTEGRHLRVHHICRQLSRSFECFFVALAESRELDDLGLDIAFADHARFDPPADERRSLWRHVRASNARYMELTWPTLYRRAVSQVAELVRSWRIECLVNMAPGLAEVGASAPTTTIQDITDSDTLTLERARGHRGGDWTTTARLKRRLNYIRQRNRERTLVRRYGVTTTISEPDRRRFLEVSGVPGDRVVVIPNGVTVESAAPGARRNGSSRSIVFWGNLGFPPNWTAIKSFFHDVFVPHLADADIDWYIVGGGESDELEAVRAHPRVHFAGFQPDLVGFVADKGVMVNPMVEGSGLKNKVLEALAIGIPVVSTALGVEAIDGVAGEHYLVADDPRELAASIVQLLDDGARARALVDSGKILVDSAYSWESIGGRYAALIERELGAAR